MRAIKRGAIGAPNGHRTFTVDLGVGAYRCACGKAFRSHADLVAHHNLERLLWKEPSALP